MFFIELTCRATISDRSLWLSRYTRALVVFRRQGDGEMRERWCVAGLLDAESRFNRVKGHKYLPQLLTALDRLVAPPTLDANCKRA